jgi:hypothetical protein
MKNKTPYVALCIFLISFTGWSQKQGRNIHADTRAESSHTSVKLQREIRMELDSRSEEIILNIEEDVDRADLVINSSLSAGTLRIELFDPVGKKEGTFSIGKQLDSIKSERVHGNIRKSLKTPEAGSWKISIIPTDATGTITIQTAYVY